MMTDYEDIFSRGDTNQRAEATGLEPAWRYNLPPVFRTGALPIRLNFQKRSVRESNSHLLVENQLS